VNAKRRRPSASRQRPAKTPKAARPRKSNEQLSAETRSKLVRIARELFGKHGFSGISAELISARARLTRGALHHQFGDKAGLFAAVVEELLRELMTSLAGETMRNLSDHQLELEKGVDVLLALLSKADVQQILLRDAPTVLGWQGFHAAIERGGLLGLIRHGLDHWVEDGRLEQERVEASSRLLLGAVIQAALALGEPSASLEPYRAQLVRLLRGLAAR
jgi:AcrR family transcriptional regulator